MAWGTRTSLANPATYQLVVLLQPCRAFTTCIYYLLQRQQKNFADLIYEMGKIDVELSLVTLLQEAQADKEDNHFIFGTCKESKDNTPCLYAQKMWHCGLDPKKAVANDIDIRATDKGVITLVITGPNAGGKSTYILGTGINIVLAQTFGIVAAKAWEQSIFYKLITYVNVTQNLAAGLSLGEAGMQVLQTHRNMLQSTKKPVFAVIDEILNGVDPNFAATYSYTILKERSVLYPNCITLLTTHYMNLGELANESPRFANKKVVVEMPGKEGRKFDFTYKIEDGLADQNIVKELLAAKGIIVD